MNEPTLCEQLAKAYADRDKAIADWHKAIADWSYADVEIVRIKTETDRINQGESK